MKPMLALIAVAGLAAGLLHFSNFRRARSPSAVLPGADPEIEQQVRAGLGASASIDVRVRNGIVALRGTASAEDRDRALAHALSVPGVRRVYSDFETEIH